MEFLCFILKGIKQELENYTAKRDEEFKEKPVKLSKKEKKTLKEEKKKLKNKKLDVDKVRKELLEIFWSGFSNWEIFSGLRRDRDHSERQVLEHLRGHLGEGQDEEEKEEVPDSVIQEEMLIEKP